MYVIALSLLFLGVGVVTALFLAYKGYADKEDAPAWIGATLCVFGGFMTLFGYVGEYGIAPDVPDNARQVATFISVLVTLFGVTGFVVWRMRNRQPVEDSPTPTVHAYGTYNAATVQMRRRRF